MLLFTLLNRISLDDTWATGLVIAVLLIAVVIILVRRDRRDRDRDRRALARTVATLYDRCHISDDSERLK